MKQPTIFSKEVLRRWADRKASLKEVRGYTGAELYSIARLGHQFFMQGKIEKARTLFQGLYAICPTDIYFAKALGVVELAAGNAKDALAAFDIAVRLAPQDASVLIGRAEVRFAMGQSTQAAEDLLSAVRLLPPKDKLHKKAKALLLLLRSLAAR
ncbi:MAG: CesD/SycD/LcrH family type III secretion system chaperone [Proteobacteria bacterium]|nr:CesD/SycD/LcrH family type III secretion system chaperone [Cystobacterineae bacterium]MCL2258748.1 CesD/SycD/LcrH family type III secretion system chaperone [Cystobacterineae bacterium]MCL2314532.1 CesD/SycD/LcrH family type III secretion system chaperone [Pseudomonadota bacterium]